MANLDIAILDANVLVAHNTRHLLLIGSDLGLYDVRWSLEILEETDRNLNRRAMKQPSKPTSDITPGERPLTRTDRKDLHVVYAAVACGATHIVTNDTEDFDLGELADLGLTLMSSDLFLATHYTAPAYADAVTKIAAPRRDPPQTPQHLSQALASKHPLLVHKYGHLFAI